MHPPKIFVQIASYRDSECKHTIDDLFRTASRPDRVFVGLHWQYVEEDADIPYFDASYNERIRIIRTPAEAAQGICWARNITQSLHAGEEFTLQLDAHMRFVDGWDDISLNLLSGLRDAGYEKPVLTHFPPDYSLDTAERSDILKRIAPFPTRQGLFVNKRTGHIVDQAASKPFLTTSLCGGFIFAHAQCIQEVPYDPYLYSQGDEISLSVRFWTHGWDLFNPARIISYHLYRRVRDKKTGAVFLPRAIIDHRKDHDDAAARDRRSLARARHLLGVETNSDPEVLAEIGKYGLGTDRTIDQYERFSGLSFRHVRRRAHTRVAWHLDEKVPLGAGLEHDLVGKAESVGRRNFSEALAKLALLIEGRSILDIGCAALPRLARDVPDPFRYVSYLGTSVFSTWVSECRSTFRSFRTMQFAQLNPVADPLPQFDLTVVPQSFASLPTKLVWQFLENVQRSGTRYLALCDAGHSPFLCGEPFLLPPPLVLAPLSTSGLTVALWETNQVALLLEAVPGVMCHSRRRVWEALSSAVDRLDFAFRQHPALLDELLRATIQTTAGQCKAILRRSEVRNVLEEADDDVMAAKDLIMGLRWRSPNSSTSTILDGSEEQSLLGMIVVCDFLEIRIAEKQ
jgi:hypothetical protein